MKLPQFVEQDRFDVGSLLIRRIKPMLRPSCFCRLLCSVCQMTDERRGRERRLGVLVIKAMLENSIIGAQL